MPMRRRRFSRRRTTVGTTAVSSRRPTRDVPVYSYVRPSSRRLTHVYPIASAENTVVANNAYPPDPAFPNVFFLNPVDQGDGIDQRHATKIYMKYMFLSGFFGLNNQMGDVSITSRFAVVYDREPRGAIPSPATVFDGVVPTSFPTLINRERFELMYSRVVTLHRTPLTSGSTSVMYSIGPNSLKFFRIRIPIFRIATWGPNSPTGDISGLTRGAMYIYFLNGYAVGDVDARMSCGFFRRLTFDDVE